MEEQQINRTELSSDGSAEVALAEDLDTVESKELKRRGDVTKCPVCGSRVDAEAYHCPSCKNYFCFHCRSRLLPSESQLQCINRDCGYYGKLVCDVCDPSCQKQEEPTVYQEPEDGYWPGLLALAVLALPFLWYYWSLQNALITSVTLFVLGGGLLQSIGVNVFGKQRTVEHPRTSEYHSCIQCGEAVKKTRIAK